MSFADFDLVKSKPYYQRPDKATLTARELQSFMQTIEGVVQIKSLQAVWIKDRRFIRLESDKGLELRDLDGDVVTLRKVDIEGQASQIYLGTSKISNVSLIEEDRPLEYRGDLPVWQVKFDDGAGFTLYLSPLDASIKSARSDSWRLYDFLWMLHILDFDEREDFHHPLLWGLALMSVIFVISGIWLFFYRLRRQDFGLAKKRAAVGKRPTSS